MSFRTRQVVGWILIASLAWGSAAAGTARDLLVDQYNQPVSSSRLTGRWLLVYFGYAQCHDVCPAALVRMRSVLTRLQSEGSAVLPVFITLDPARDTPVRLREFAAQFNPKMLALTGSPGAIADAASRFGVMWKPSASGAEFDHGALWYLVSPQSRVIKVVHPTQSVEEITQTLLTVLPRSNLSHAAIDE